MTDDRYKQIMADLGMPDSVSLMGALKQVANEVSQEGIKHRTSTELLRELIERNDYSDAAKKTTRQGVWHSSIVGIGVDNIADICFTDEALQALYRC